MSNSKPADTKTNGTAQVLVRSEEQSGAGPAPSKSVYIPAVLTYLRDWQSEIRASFTTKPVPELKSLGRSFVIAQEKWLRVWEKVAEFVSNSSEDDVGNLCKASSSTNAVICNMLYALRQTGVIRPEMGEPAAGALIQSQIASVWKTLKI